ncbi:glycosyltransferase [Spiribacter roseus]|uniref:glycosyltransferase n=1 Tax=Spiribacter roseus TaxID=1855875 RepID=UPI001F3746C3|nr:glycosyltransferase [Spiribacter roseus]
MRILHAIPSLEFKYGGPSQSAASLMNGLAELACVPASIRLLCKSDAHEVAVSSKITRQDIDFLYERYWVPSVKEVKTIRRSVSDADIIHVHSYWNIFASLVVHEALAADRPVVLSPRGVLHWKAIAYRSRYLKKLFAGIFVNRQLGHVTAYHFQSDEEAANSVTGRRNDPAPRIVADNGVGIPSLKTSAHAAREQTVGTVSGDFHLLFFGRLNRIKGIGLQIDALRRLRASGIDAKLHLVGPDDGVLEGLKALADQLGITSHLHVHGAVFGQSKYLWLRGADVVLMSSEFENNSNAALEVMAAGGVLVATKASVSISAEDLGAALRVDASVEALEAGIRRVIYNKELATSLRSQAMKYVRNYHDWSSRAGRIYSFYESLL